jgi:hypothetical protein
MATKYARGERAYDGDPRLKNAVINLPLSYYEARAVRSALSLLEHKSKRKLSDRAYEPVGVVDLEKARVGFCEDITERLNSLITNEISKFK